MTEVGSAPARDRWRFVPMVGWIRSYERRWLITGVAIDRRRRSLPEEAAMWTLDQPGLGWTVVLRRQPARIVEGRVQGGYTNAWELVCGDHPDLDYREVSPELQRIRGPYPVCCGRRGI